MTALDQLCITTLRTLSIDAVQQAQSGHPGTPMGAAPSAYCLWQRFLRYDPQEPHWPNRDRFVLSAGHACALLYSLLHLSGVQARGAAYPQGQRLAVSMDDLRNFRQAGSHCTGHPEYGWTTGVETTTGPLGQGAATSVGMAIAQRWQAATYGRPGFDALFAHRVYALCGDGDMMEGVSAEAASLAGHLKLSNLCWMYDANGITIEGSTSLAFTEDVAARFVAYGWHVVRVADGNDLTRLDAAYQSFLDTPDRPTLIVVHSHIGYGSPHKQDTREAHGEALGAEEVRLVKQFYGCDPEKQFDVPGGVREHFDAHVGQRGGAARAAWNTLFATYRAEHPQLAAQIDALQGRDLPHDWERDVPGFAFDTKGLSTRDASGQVLNAIAARMPWLLGGAADLATSTKTGLQGAADFEAPAIGDAAAPGVGYGYGGRNFHFGVREHAMCAIGNGMSLSLLRPYVASFLVFTDYCRAALRLAAMMELPLISIWTHDSISMGEDGPTHQPIEHLASLRAMPGMLTLRPADANEVAWAWRVIMRLKSQPVCLILTRQAVPTLDRARYGGADGLARGAYILADAPDGRPDVLLLASGSEVALCLSAFEQLQGAGIKARVVSMPSWELFDSQPQAYREEILPPRVLARVAVEEAAAFGWERYTGIDGAMLGLHTFGMSAPMALLVRHFGFTTEHVLEAAKAQIARHASRSAP
ncbi:transketolase [Oxalobacteraceae bacterium GrIS 1.11]